MGIPLISDPGDLSEAEANDLLLKTHLALVQAQTDRDILAALALCVRGEARLRLVYLELDDAGQPCGMRQMATYAPDEPGESEAEMGCHAEMAQCPLISALRAQRDPVWFVDGASASAMRLTCPLAERVGRLVAVKLFGAAHVEQQAQWHSVVYVTWCEAGSFNRAERRLFVSLWETLCVVVSNHRLRVDALDHLHRLRQIDRMKTQFLRTFGHELRTPLIGILTVADLLLNAHELSQPVQDDVRIILKSGEHLLALMNDILDMASIEAGRMTIVREGCDVAAVVADTVQTLRPLAQSMGLDIETTIPERLPVIGADPKRLRQALLNLLSNAIKYSEQGIIRVHVRCDDDGVLISVQDEGIGIAPEHQRLIFDQFQRIDTSQARRAGGAGLGLPIARHLVELHGGRLTVTSAPGQGSTFAIRLPVGDEHADSVH
jgi:signal transduction histidine kinase